jgi:hypothetical protein
MRQFLAALGLFAGNDRLDPVAFAGAALLDVFRFARGSSGGLTQCCGFARGHRLSGFHVSPTVPSSVAPAAAEITSRIDVS